MAASGCFRIVLRSMGQFPVCRKPEISFLLRASRAEAPLPKTEELRLVEWLEGFYVRHIHREASKILHDCRDYAPPKRKEAGSCARYAEAIIRA